MSDFWDDMNEVYAKDASSVFDNFLRGKELGGPAFTGLRDMTAQAAESLALPVEAGTRVRFIANLGSVLTYPNVPDTKVAGTVVTVRTSSGDATYDNNRVFVAWDDGVFRAIAPAHLRSFTSGRQAKNVRMVVADLGDLSDFFGPSVKRANDLVHKATKDLWTVKQQGGQFSIERLFDSDGEPLKGI